MTVYVPSISQKKKQNYSTLPHIRIFKCGVNIQQGSTRLQRERLFYKIGPWNTISPY